MDPIARAMFMGAAGVEGLPPIGESYEGGYIAGYISHNGNGVATHGLVVAPAASGYNSQTALQWKTSTTASNVTSDYDGAANTATIANTTHPAANYCANLSIGGYTDWYLPARLELEIAYFNLKPTTGGNTGAWGTNSYAVPARSSNYTTGNPAQTTVTAFQSGGTEAFDTGFHWASTENSGDPLSAYIVIFSDGAQSAGQNKTKSRLVRAFRKFAV